MTTQKPTCYSPLRLLIISIAVLLSTAVMAQKQKTVVVEKDSTRLFNGVAVSADLAGAVQMQVSSYGQYELGLHVNLRDKYMVVVEAGVGKADADDPSSGLRYKTNAPYGRVGVDFNLTKNKHDIYRVLGGVRYGFTSFKYNVEGKPVTDPVWGDVVPYSLTDVSCSQHWLELLGGVDAKIWGPLRMGWTVRYRRRLMHDDGDYGEPWYVPGYGRAGNSRLGATFNITFEL